MACLLSYKEILMGATVVPVWREGVLWFNKEPQYIIRQTDFPGGESVVGVYNVSKETYKESNHEVIVKDWSVVQQPIPFSENTPLARFARSKVAPKKERREKPALYTSRVVDGISTFGGKEGLGFYEYTPEEYSATRRAYLPSTKTGVFILLDDVKWYTDIHMDNKALLKLLTEDAESRTPGLYKF